MMSRETLLLVVILAIFVAAGVGLSLGVKNVAEGENRGEYHEVQRIGEVCTVYRAGGINGSVCDLVLCRDASVMELRCR